MCSKAAFTSARLQRNTSPLEQKYLAEVHSAGRASCGQGVGSNWGGEMGLGMGQHQGWGPSFVLYLLGHKNVEDDCSERALLRPRSCRAAQPEHSLQAANSSLSSPKAPGAQTKPNPTQERHGQVYGNPERLMKKRGWPGAQINPTGCREGRVQEGSTVGSSRSPTHFLSQSQEWERRSLGIGRGRGQRLGGPSQPR